MTHTLRARLAELHPRRFFLETWQRVDAEAARERAKNPNYDYKPLIAFAVGGICLTIMEYFGSTSDFAQLVNKLASGDSALGALAEQLRHSEFYRLAKWGWWTAFRVIGFFLIPALVVKLVFRESLRDHGLQTKGFSEHAWIYAVCYFAVLGLVVIVSFDTAFTSYYPFYNLSHRSWLDFATWELLYAAQFFSLEFFFRGFWLKTCRTTMGSYAIVAMILPYCMIHFGKPWLECIGAIGAGVVLGTLAMKTRSIWSGFLIHVSVAISMDVASLLRGSGLPTRLLPF